MWIEGQRVNLFEREIEPVRMEIQEGRIRQIYPGGEGGPYLLPGFVDAHVHIESSLCIPTEFARGATPHGTVATVSDPHEIANVLGVKGIEWMIENARQVPFKFFFGIPSCVPATKMETAGAELGVEQVEELFDRWDLKYLSEVMNFPGVLAREREVMAKIDAAKRRGKPVDGHAPGLRGEAARHYFEAGISTDHECFLLAEAEEKADLGMRILIREGSAARNFDALHPILKSHPELAMFCSDDKHPDSLEEGHIDQLVRRALKLGYDLFDVLRAASLHPVLHYGLEVGLLREGDPADFIVVEDLEKMEVHQTYIDGERVAEQGRSLLRSISAEPVNQFRAKVTRPDQFLLDRQRASHIIGAVDGELITEALYEMPTDQDQILAVVNRHSDAPPALAHVRGFALRSGAIAGSVAHDSHNIIAVGVDEESLSAAINEVIRHQGGLSVVHPERTESLPLPLAGLMSLLPFEEVTRRYRQLDGLAKSLGSPLQAPFMTLSFMALLVIPELKLSDKGLFRNGKHVGVAEEDEGGPHDQGGDERPEK